MKLMLSVIGLLCAAGIMGQTVNNGPNEWRFIEGRYYQTIFDNANVRRERHHQVMEYPDYLWDFVQTWRVTEGNQFYDWVEVEGEYKRMGDSWTPTRQVKRRITYNGDRTNTVDITNPVNRANPVIGDVGTWTQTNLLGWVTRTFNGKATVQGIWGTNLWRWNWLDTTNFLDESRLDCWYFHNGSNEPMVLGEVMLHPGTTGEVKLVSLKPQNLWTFFRCLPCYPHVPPQVCAAWTVLHASTNDTEVIVAGKGVKLEGTNLHLFFPFDNNWNRFSIESSPDLKRWHVVTNGIFEMEDDLRFEPPGIKLTVPVPQAPTFWRLRDLGFSRRRR